VIDKASGILNAPPVTLGEIRWGHDKKAAAVFDVAGCDIMIFAYVPCVSSVFLQSKIPDCRRGVFSFFVHAGRLDSRNPQYLCGPI
jgi:hypothetical protein